MGADRVVNSRSMETVSAEAGKFDVVIMTSPFVGGDLDQAY